MVLDDVCAEQCTCTRLRSAARLFARLTGLDGHGPTLFSCITQNRYDTYMIRGERGADQARQYAGKYASTAQITILSSTLLYMSIA